MSKGYLELFIGPMNTAKTFRLEQLYNEHKTISSSVVIINKCSKCSKCKGCNNCSNCSNCLNHLGDKNYCIVKTDNLMDVWSNNISLNILEKDRNQFKIAKSNVDDGHMYPDLIEFVELLLKDGKRVYVFGLDGDVERKKIGHMLDLIPICDKVSKLTSFCQICKDGTPGIFTKRLPKNVFALCCDVFAVCRKCYEE